MKGLINFRSLSKRWYRLTHAATYHHCEKIWPYVQVDRDAQGCIESMRYRHQPIQVCDVSELSATSQDGLLIIASGPSLKDLDLSGLQHLDWMAVNGSTQVLQHYPQQPLKYYVVIDQGFVQDRIAMIAEVVNQTEVVFVTNLLCLNKIYELLGVAQIKARLWVLEDRQKGIYLPRYDASTMYQRSLNSEQGLHWRLQEQVGFSTDLKRGYISGGTVVYLSLQLALALGYKKVYLAGVDMKRFDAPRFYEQADTRLNTQLDKMFEHTIYPSFLLAAQIYRQFGVQGYNLCLDSGLDDAIFPRIDLKQHLSE